MVEYPSDLFAAEYAGELSLCPSLRVRKKVMIAFQNLLKVKPNAVMGYADGRLSPLQIIGAVKKIVFNFCL
jgi:hypothetical protein